MRAEKHSLLCDLHALLQDPALELGHLGLGLLRLGGKVGPPRHRHGPVEIK